MKLISKYIFPGVLGTIKRKVYSIHSNEVRESVTQYYRDENNSRICSGIKDCISVKNPITNITEKLQKRLLMYDLKDLYNNWVEEEYEQHFKDQRKPGFSIFASLRPKECISAGAPGTHTICVCPIHQNVKLKLSAINKNLAYRVILNDCVCSTDWSDCMLHLCKNCPGKAEILKILESSSCEDVSEIEYHNWVNNAESQSNNRVSLIMVKEPTRNFIINLANDLWELTKHHYVTEMQKCYLKHCKTIITPDTCIILQDFAENFLFVCQDSIQAFYFNNTQATVNPFVVYYKKDNNDKLQTLSVCVISDCLKHDACAVSTFQGQLIALLKRDFPFIENVHYMSDGAPTQYKNK